LTIFDAETVFRTLRMNDCIELMRNALAGLERGTSVQPMRSIHRLPQGEIFGFMPAYLGVDSHFGAKVATAFPGNLGTEYPTHMGFVLLFESAHGSPVALVDATSITKIRTGAVSGVATDLLSRRDSRSVALVGAGEQARSHLDAMMVVRKLERAFVFDVDESRARTFAEESGQKHSIPVTVCLSAEEAVREADIICTVTPAKEPYLEFGWVKPGTHINAVGAFTPTAREITSGLVAGSRLYADWVESMKSECGEFLIPKSEGLIDDDHIVGSVGELVLGRVPARQSVDEITLFDALGLAVEDVACAQYVFLNAQ